MRVAKQIGIAALVSCALPCTVNSQGLAPDEADVVVECFKDGKPAHECSVSCGTELKLLGEGPTWTNVSRLEIFHKGATGRTDGRVFMFAEHRTGPGDPPQVIVGDLAPNVSCGWQSVSMVGENRDIKLEMRITKFRFND
jgi:hypothetical protein